MSDNFALRLFGIVAEMGLCLPRIVCGADYDVVAVAVCLRLLSTLVHR